MNYLYLFVALWAWCRAGSALNIVRSSLLIEFAQNWMYIFFRYSASASLPTVFEWNANLVDLIDFFWYGWHKEKKDEENTILGTAFSFCKFMFMYVIYANDAKNFN